MQGKHLNAAVGHSSIVISAFYLLDQYLSVGQIYHQG